MVDPIKSSKPRVKKTVDTDYSIDGRGVGKKDYFRTLKKGRRGLRKTSYLINGQIVSRGKYCSELWALRGRGFPVKVPGECISRRKRKAKPKKVFNPRFQELRDKIKQKGVKAAPPVKQSGKLEKEESKDREGVGRVVGGIIWAVAAGLWALVWWLWKRDKGGDSDDSTKGLGSEKLPVYAAELKSIASSLNHARFGAESAGVSIYSQAKGIHISLYPQSTAVGREHTISHIEGMSNRDDVIPLAYYWVQEEIRRKDGATAAMSEMFFHLADIYSGANTASHRCVPNNISGLADLVIWTDLQIRLGHGLFNVEAMTAHLGAYWKSKAAPKMENHMHQALKALSNGNAHLVLKNLEEAADSCLRLQPHPDDELGVIGALHNLNLAELEYRFAACEEDNEIRMKHLAQAERRVENASAVLKNHRRTNSYDHTSIVEYADRLSSEIQNAARARSLTPVGIYVPGYGPTSASIIPLGPKSKLPTIIPLTPLTKMI
jgi:hypothetical protein